MLPTPATIVLKEYKPGRWGLLCDTCRRNGRPATTLLSGDERRVLTIADHHNDIWHDGAFTIKVLEPPNGQGEA